MRRAEMEDIMREVKENSFKLKRCKHHVFEPVKHKPCRYRCVNCGAEADSSYVSGYSQGLEHGGDNENRN